MTPAAIKRGKICRQEGKTFALANNLLRSAVQNVRRGLEDNRIQTP